MKLVVGLGNPGPPYARTRHNAGADVVERFAARRRIALDAQRFRGRFGSGRVGDEATALLIPETYMNRSGDAVADAVAGLAGLDPARDLMVVFDDVDLPFARLRMRRTGGSGGHRGLADVIERLGSADFGRLRFGVGRPPPDVSTVDWVLSPFADAEREALPAALDAAADALDAFVRLGVDMAMDRTNRLSSPPVRELAAREKDEPPE